MEMEGNNRGIEGKVFVVTGGDGLAGSALCLELLRRGAREVRSFDLRSGASPWSDQLRSRGVRCIQGDVTSFCDVEKALRGADCVFHLASYGSSGKEMLQAVRNTEVNVSGTCNVLEACVECGITRLVYSSTYDVVFGGKEIENGDETLPYFPVDDNINPYGRSKSIAEEYVLKNNGRPVKKGGGKHLYTCAVRPAAVYGPGEERYLPRITSLAKLGLLLSKIGGTSVKTDWIYVDNLVLALILASMGLLDEIPGKEGNPIASGQPYFVSDGSPVNSFEFLRPLLRGLDYDLSKSSLSVPHALFLGRIFQVLYTILNPLLHQWWLPQPLILPAEVYKVGVTHYMSIHKAKEELGYSPAVTPQDGMAATISYFQDRKRKSLDGPSIYAWLFCIFGLPGLLAVAWLPDIGPIPFLRSIGLFFFRSRKTIRTVSLICLTAHVSEAVYAWFLAKRVDPHNATGWFWQTLVVATFSLRYLWKRSKNKASLLSSSSLLVSKYLSVSNSC